MIRLAVAALAGCLTVTAAQGQSSQAQVQPLQLQSPLAQQDAQAPESVPYAEPPAAEEGPSPGNRPGFLDALGRWLGDSKAAIDSQMKSTQETLGTLGSQARDAASTVVAVPGSRIITGRQLCPPAANGAPDCEQGVEALCRAKGFQNGRSLDVTSSQRCPAKVWMSGRPPVEGECRLETYVTRAVCQ
ncbi:MAG: hypothetical protein GEU95_12825 [Rhizobiales bacterium]|nr:hypothetical protein [Hyphomicrobiales bacterium]